MMAATSMRNGTSGAGPSDILVVGNAFREFADGDTCLTVDELVALPAARLGQVQHIVMGQGVGAEAIGAVYVALKKADALDKVEVVESVSHKVNPGVAHKVHSRNAIITAPRQIGDALFEADLVVDEGCAGLSDHITGVHVPGILFMEAARQAYIACARTLMQEPGLGVPAGDRRFTMIYMNSQYHNYVYPLPTHLLVQLLNVRYLRRTDFFVAEMVMEVAQLDAVCVTVRAKGSAGSGTSVAGKERLGAGRALAKLTERLPTVCAGRPATDGGGEAA